jgi:predicted SAM-dependent methyltransferase
VAIEQAMKGVGMKLNLGCGSRKEPGFLNVDKFQTSATDVVFDLEKTPWPWPNDSIEEVRFIHSLEHMGQTTDGFLTIVKEVYRICRDGAKVIIHVPHPRHDNYLGDPTHVRPITPQMLTLFNRQLNNQWVAEKISAATPLGIYIDVDFFIQGVSNVLDNRYYNLHSEGRLSSSEIADLVRERNNVISECHIEWIARKPSDTR